MAENNDDKSIDRPAGYSELIKRCNLEVIPHWHTSQVTTSGIHRIDSSKGFIKEVYPPIYWPGESLGDHLEFALKHDGINFAILASFDKLTRFFLRYLYRDIKKYLLWAR